MELALVLTELSNAPAQAKFSDAMPTRARSFLQPRTVLTKSSQQRKSARTTSTDSDSAADLGNEEGDECPRVMDQRRRQRDCKKQQQQQQQQQQQRLNGNSSNSAAAATSDDGDEAPPRSEAKLERTRQLQNLRQRRYRARKKCSLSALQQRSQQLADDNARLESAIRNMLALP